MTPEEYQKQMAELGVQRGAFSTHFTGNHGPHGNPALGAERVLISNARKKLTRESLGLPAEDLSHLNPKYHGKSRLGGRVCPNCQCRRLKKSERVCEMCRASKAIPKGQRIA